MDDENRQYIRLECLKMAVSAEADCDSVLDYALDYYNFVMLAEIPEENVVKFPHIVEPPDQPA